MTKAADVNVCVSFLTEKNNEHKAQNKYNSSCL